MNLKEMKTKVLGLIEELSPQNPLLTDDDDIATKLNNVINQIMFEICRIKKIPKYISIDVSEGDVIDFADLERACGYEVQQVKSVYGVDFETRADGTVYKVLESGKMEFDVYVFPERITDKTKDAYEFELSAEALEIMPFGIAGDLLKTDVSASNGQVYSTRYETMLGRLDARYNIPTITFEGGVNV